METIITIELPFKRIPAPDAKCRSFMPARVRWFGWLIQWSKCTVQEFGGRRVNTTRHLSIFRWHLLTMKRNEWHDRSDEERASEYLAEWSACEKALRGLRLLQMGDEVTDPELRKLLRDGLGINLDEGTS